MSNTARKARKRAGVKFERTSKVGTPFLERNHMLRSPYKVARELQARTPDLDRTEALRIARPLSLVKPWRPVRNYTR